jgi:uncharacterized LabA/DUF88 family protein
MSSFPTAGIYIDGANIFHGGKDAGWMLDYSKLISFVNRKFDPQIFAYYNCTGYEFNNKGKRQRDPLTGEYILNIAQVTFHRKLEGMGIRVTTKPLKLVLGNRNTAKNKMDSELVLAAYKESSLWQELLLFTGDCDFEPLVEEMKSQKKKVHIFSYKNNTSFELKKQALNSPFVTYTKLDDLRSLLTK